MVLAWVREAFFDRVVSFKHVDLALSKIGQHRRSILDLLRLVPYSGHLCCKVVFLLLKLQFRRTTSCLLEIEKMALTQKSLRVVHDK